VLVQVRGTDRQPGVVDNRGLRMDVDGRAARLEQRAREETILVPAFLGRGDEDAELSARVVAAVVRIRRKQNDGAEVVARRLAQLRREDLDQLWRPEELALDVDEPLNGAKRTHVALEDRELAQRQTVVEVVRHSAPELDRVATGLRGLDRRQGAPPPQTEVLGDI